MKVFKKKGHWYWEEEIKCLLYGGYIMGELDKEKLTKHIELIKEQLNVRKTIFAKERSKQQTNSINRTILRAI